jgi:hypothetical protein
MTFKTYDLLKGIVKKNPYKDYDCQNKDDFDMGRECGRIELAQEILAQEGIPIDD